MGPMKAPEGGHVDPARILEKRWGDGTSDHYWDVFGTGGWAYALVRPDGSVMGVPTDWATGPASTPEFRRKHPDHALVKLPRYGGRGL